MRKVPAGLFVLLVFIGITVVTTQHAEQLEPTMYEYMITNFQRDTSAHNAVAAILLNYRMYDTMFEALILLTAIIGMKEFLPGVGEFPGSTRKRDSNEAGGSGGSED